MCSCEHDSQLSGLHLKFLGLPLCNWVPTLTVNVVFRLQGTLVSGTFEGEGTTFRQTSEIDSTLTECDVSEVRYPQVNRCENLKTLVVGIIILSR
jgi:hypothetical protein